MDDITSSNKGLSDGHAHHREGHRCEGSMLMSDSIQTLVVYYMKINVHTVVINTIYLAKEETSFLDLQ